MEITRKTVLADIVSDPKTEKILAKHNVPCLSCPYAKYEMEELELGQICDTYGIDCEKLIEDLNKEINKKK
ncbi:MAG: hypothetical protein PHG23_03250 [Candidatus Pacebacteria bacterium]|nr:hypothetical protein [Candidatus Paceibacterota bacterium]